MMLCVTTPMIFLPLASTPDCRVSTRAYRERLDGLLRLDLVDLCEGLDFVDRPVHVLDARVQQRALARAHQDLQHVLLFRALVRVERSDRLDAAASQRVLQVELRHLDVLAVEVVDLVQVRVRARHRSEQAVLPRRVHVDACHRLILQLRVLDLLGRLAHLHLVDRVVLPDHPQAVVYRLHVRYLCPGQRDDHLRSMLACGAYCEIL